MGDCSNLLPFCIPLSLSSPATCKVRGRTAFHGVAELKAPPGVEVERKTIDQVLNEGEGKATEPVFVESLESQCQTFLLDEGRRKGEALSTQGCCEQDLPQGDGRTGGALVRYRRGSLRGQCWGCSIKDQSSE